MLALNSPVHHGAAQASQYPRCSPVRRSSPNPPTPQPPSETKPNQGSNRFHQNGEVSLSCSHTTLHTCFPVYSLVTGVSRRSRLASSWVAVPLSSRPSRRHTSITSRSAARVSTLRHDGMSEAWWETLHGGWVVCCQLTSILASVCRCSGWSLRSFPKAVRRVA